MDPLAHNPPLTNRRLFFLMLLATTIITVFPEIVLYLPRLMVGK